MPDLVYTSSRQSQSDPIYFVLDDVKYEFYPPKTEAIFMSAGEPLAERIRIQLNWLSAGLSEEQAAHLKEQTFDFHDGPRWPDLIKIVSDLIEEATGRPTTPSPE